MRYPPWKLIVLLVLGPPAAAGCWYVCRHFQGGKYHVSGFAIWCWSGLVFPKILIFALASTMIYFFARAERYVSWKRKAPSKKTLTKN